MELFQAAALIHDDVMDDSDTRRGMPAAHRALATRHADRGWAGDERAVRPRGRGARRQPLPHLDRRRLRDLRPARGRPRARPPGVRPDAHPADGRPVPRRRRVDAALGRPARRGARRAGRPGDPLQERQVHRRAPAAHRRHHRRARRRRAARRCPATASTSVGPSSCATTCSASSATRSETGKPAGDDLREGKRTVLLAHALAGTDASGRARVEALLGRPDLDAAPGRRAARRHRGVRGGRPASRTRSTGLAGSARAALDGRRRRSTTTRARRCSTWSASRPPAPPDRVPTFSPDPGSFTFAPVRKWCEGEGSRTGRESWG